MILLFALACSTIDPTTVEADTAALDTAAALDTDAPSDTGAAPEQAPSFSTVYALLRASCAGCHSDGYAGNFLVAGDPEASYDLLLAAEPHHDGQAHYVVPGDADASLLLDKLSAEPSFGETMPPEDAYARALSDEQIAQIRAWIVAGAMGP